MDKTDRCDRCSAEAMNRWQKFGNPGDLYFCQHHHNTHEDSLKAQSWTLAESKLVPA